MNIFFRIFFVFGTSILIAETRPDLPKPYNTVEVLPFVNHGWNTNDVQIKEIFQSRQIKTVIEVGSWMGKSTMEIASLLPKEGKLYAVDHWKGSAEHQPGQPDWAPQLPYLYEQFLSNVIHAELTHIIVPVRMDSLKAASFLYYVVPDLIYIDASHETQAVYDDLNAWYPYVEGHGVLCGDDWHWGDVRKAVQAFAGERDLDIWSSGNFWKLIDPKIK